MEFLGREALIERAARGRIVTVHWRRILERWSEDYGSHDLYRLLVATRTEDIAQSLRRLQTDPLAGPTTDQALTYLADLFAAGPGAPGSMMAGRAEEGIGEPITVATSAAVLATDLLDAIRNPSA